MLPHFVALSIIHPIVILSSSSSSSILHVNEFGITSSLLRSFGAMDAKGPFDSFRHSSSASSSKSMHGSVSACSPGMKRSASSGCEPDLAGTKKRKSFGNSGTPKILEPPDMKGFDGWIPSYGKGKVVPVLSRKPSGWRERWSGVCDSCFKAGVQCEHHKERPLRLLIMGHNPSVRAWESGISCGSLNVAESTLSFCALLISFFIANFPASRIRRKCKRWIFFCRWYEFCCSAESSFVCFLLLFHVAEQSILYACRHHLF